MNKFLVKAGPEGPVERVESMETILAGSSTSPLWLETEERPYYTDDCVTMLIGCNHNCLTDCHNLG